MFLSPREVITHFHLDANGLLNKWEERFRPRLPSGAGEAREALSDAWDRIAAMPSTGKGNWDKVLKRCYGAAARCSSDILDDQMYDHLVLYPELSPRIFECLARRNEDTKLLRLFKRYCRNGECLFEAVEAMFFDACLLLNTGPVVEEHIRELAEAFTKGKVVGQARGPYGKAAAMLCLYWFDSDPAAIAHLFPANDATVLPVPVARSWLAIAAARNPSVLTMVQAKLVGHPSDDVSRLSQFLNEVLSGAVPRVKEYAAKRPRWPMPGEFYDARAWLQLELFSHSSSPDLRKQIEFDAQRFAAVTKTRPESRILKRVRDRVGLKTIPSP